MLICFRFKLFLSLSVSHKIYHHVLVFSTYSPLFHCIHCIFARNRHVLVLFGFLLTSSHLNVFFLFPGQAPSSGHHSYCSGKAQLHPVPPDGPVLGPPQPQRRQGHEAEVQPQLQQELQTPLLTGPQAEETLQPPLLR